MPRYLGREKEEANTYSYTKGRLQMRGQVYLPIPD